MQAAITAAPNSTDDGVKDEDPAAAEVKPDADEKPVSILFESDKSVLFM